MYQFKSKILIFMSTIMLLLNMSCGGSSEDSENSAVSNDSPPASTTMQTNIDNQNQLEEEATSSLETATVEGSFEFGTQKALSIDLQFANTMFNEEISIYSTIDADSNAPINLLEQGTIIRSSHYKTIMYIATELDSLIIVRNDNVSAFTEVTIDISGQVTHFFEE